MQGRWHVGRTARRIGGKVKFKFSTNTDFDVWALLPCVIVEKSSARSEFTIAAFFLSWGFAVDVSW